MPRELNEAEGIEPGVAEAVGRAIELCGELGAEVEECELPRSVEYGLPCYYLIAPAEASSNLARYDGVRYGHRAGATATYVEMYERTRDDGFGDEPKRRIMLGTYALSAGYYDAFYGQAQKVRTVIARRARAPPSSASTCSSARPRRRSRSGSARRRRTRSRCTSRTCSRSRRTWPACPGSRFPCGLSDGLPVGLQLIGPQFSENMLFRAGHALEHAIGFDSVPERLR